MQYKTVKLPFKIQYPVLALGSQAKNTVCFMRGDAAHISPIHQDLSIPDNLLVFEKTVKYFLKKRPRLIACDIHPEYQSTKYASSLRAGYPLVAIQHHHAHIASCMAERLLNNQKVIGVAFDGTGVGVDNTLWGAEFMVCDYKKSVRVAHLLPVPLIGGERAIAEPVRIALAWLFLVYQDAFLKFDIGIVRKMKRSEWVVFKAMLLSKFNTPLASSMGRLFDAAASLILERPRARFEAELAVALERLAVRCRQQIAAYPFAVIRQKDMYIIDPRPLFKGVVKDIENKRPKEEMAYRFHLAVARMIVQMCLRIRKNTGIKKVILSGGVFQNKLLLALSSDLLFKEGLLAYMHREVPCNDAAVSLGQAAVASFKEDALCA